MSAGGRPDAENTYRFNLTNLPPAVRQRQIADIYRVRWEIELDNKLDKSCNNLDEIRAATGPAVRALVHASIISSMLACLLVHIHRLKEGSPGARRRERKYAPLHPQNVARTIGSSAAKLAAAFSLPQADAEREWETIAGIIQHLGFDPNWRRSPSILDQMRGWKISPGRSRRKKAASLPNKGANANCSCRGSF